MICISDDKTAVISDQCTKKYDREWHHHKQGKKKETRARASDNLA
jgi:hypothetical protein